MDYFFTKQGARVSLFDFGWSKINNQLSSWEAGQRGKLSITKVHPPKTKQQLGYYYAVIIPEAIEAFRTNEDYSLSINIGARSVEIELTIDNMDTFLKSRYKAMVGKEVSKASMSIVECSEYEDWCVKWLKTWLNCEVSIANKDWRKYA